MSRKALQRILKIDLKSVEEQNLKSHGIYIEFDENDMTQAKAMIIGPEESLYEGGFLFFKIKFPANYPFSPPDVAYISRNKVRIHPNIYVGGRGDYTGKVCLSILGTWSGPSWTSIMNISTVLLSIQSLLDSQPLYHEPGYSKAYQSKRPSNLYSNYNRIIENETFRTLIYKNITDIPEGFECFLDDMKTHLRLKKDNLLTKLEKITPSENYIVNSSIYRIYDYKVSGEYLENVKQLLKQI